MELWASIFKRKNTNGTTVWRAVVRIKGYPTVCNHFERKQEADDWAQKVERQIKAGHFKFDQHNQIHTFAEFIDRYIQDGTLEHHRSGGRYQVPSRFLENRRLRSCPHHS